MPGLEDLYREIILDHYRNPRNRGELERAARHAGRGLQPAVRRRDRPVPDIDGDVVRDIRIGGQGCSISQSSASMMSSAVKGRSLDEVRALSRAFKGMMSIHEQALDGEGAGGNGSGEPSEAGAEVKLGDLEALRGVVKFPVRIKCATLSWNTLLQGLDESTS